MNYSEKNVPLSDLVENWQRYRRDNDGAVEQYQTFLNITKKKIPFFYEIKFHKVNIRYTRDLIYIII